MTRPVSRFLLVSALLVLPMPGSAQKPAPARPAPAAAPPAPPATPLPAAPATPAAAAPAPGAPALGRLRVFEDWAVGCDNRLSCSAVSLLPEGTSDVYKVLVWIGREGGPQGEATIELSGAYELRGKIDLRVDNEPAGQLIAARDAARASGANALKLIRRLGSSYAFEVREGGTFVSAPSLSGLAQALRYIDELQGRVGSEGALAAIGDRPADLARPLPEDAQFNVTGDSAPPGGPAALNDVEKTGALTLARCGGRTRADLPIDLHALDDRHTLALIACDAGADNVSSIALIASGEPGARSFEIARFDLMPGFTGEPGTAPLIVNAQWNPAKAALSSFSRGRPLGDCGTAETYRWDGAMFRLTQARAMPVCRGAWEWPVIWSATPVEAPTVTAQAAADPAAGTQR